MKRLGLFLFAFIVRESIANQCLGKPEPTFLPIAGECADYISCAKQKEYVRRCPQPYWFNSENQMCDFPEHQNCKIECEQPTGVHYQFYPNSCNNYIMCINGIPKFAKCPESYEFDENDRRCKPVTENPQCKYKSKTSRNVVEAPVAPIQPMLPTRELIKKIGAVVLEKLSVVPSIHVCNEFEGTHIIANPYDCTYFLVCQNKRPYFAKCAKGKAFDYKESRCVEKELATCRASEDFPEDEPPQIEDLPALEPLPEHPAINPHNVAPKPPRPPPMPIQPFVGHGRRPLPPHLPVFPLPEMPEFPSVPVNPNPLPEDVLPDITPRRRPPFPERPLPPAPAQPLPELPEFEPRHRPPFPGKPMPSVPGQPLPELPEIEPRRRPPFPERPMPPSMPQPLPELPEIEPRRRPPFPERPMPPSMPQPLPELPEIQPRSRFPIPPMRPSVPKPHPLPEEPSHPSPPETRPQPKHSMPTDPIMPAPIRPGVPPMTPPKYDPHVACPDAIGTQYFPNPYNCRYYIRCESGEPFIDVCQGEGEIFDIHSNTCLPEAEATCKRD